MGIGDAKDDPKLLDKAQEELIFNSWSKAVKTKAKKQLLHLKLEKEWL